MLLNYGVGEDSWESLGCKEIQPVHPEGDQSWVFIGRTAVEAETPVLWPPDVKSWLFGKDPDAGKEWGQEEKGMTEDEMVGWHHWLDGHGFGWAPGVGDGLGGLACCGSWGCKESDMTERLNWTELNTFSQSDTPFHLWCHLLFQPLAQQPSLLYFLGGAMGFEPSVWVRLTCTVGKCFGHSILIWGHLLLFGLAYCKC